jgi:hypothetical protein
VRGLESERIFSKADRSDDSCLDEFRLDQDGHIIGLQRHLDLIPDDYCSELSGNVSHDFGQLAGTDLVEEAIELDVFRNSRAVAQQLDVVVERFLEIHDGEAVVIK